MSPRVAVVGAGIIGAALADQLTRQGAAVTLIDAAAPGQGTSATSLAWINANQKTPHHYFVLNLAGMHAWHELAARFDHPAWYIASGHLTWAVTDQDRHELSQRWHRLRDWGYRAEQLKPHQASRLEPHLAIPAHATVAYFPDEAYAHAGQAAAALATRAHDHGAIVRTGDPVVGIDTRGHKAQAARLASGARVPADVIVLAAGHHTPTLAAQIGVDVDLVPPGVPRSRAVCLVATTTGLSPRPQHVLHAPHVRIRAGPEGGAHLESSDINARIDQASHEAQLHAAADTLLERAAEVWPRPHRPVSSTHSAAYARFPATATPLSGGQRTPAGST